jgi:hypothetical protein
VLLSAGGGTSYFWNTGATTSSITATAHGNYTVTATGAGGCEASASLEITVGIAPGFTITLDEGCYRTLLAAPPNATYLWNTGATTQMLLAASGNTYTVEAVDGLGCTGSGTVTVP